MTSRADRLATRFNDLAAPLDHSADGPQHTDRSLRPTEAGRQGGWDASHKRVTYWMHVEVIAHVRQAAERNGESVAAFVDRALRRELQQTAAQESPAAAEG
jgi:hypothetical protein